MAPRIATILILLVAAGDDSFDRFLTGLRSQEPERREAAIEAFLADPGIVPAERWDRAEKAILRVMSRGPGPKLRGQAALCLRGRLTAETAVELLEQLSGERDWRAQRPMLEALEGLDDETVLALLEKRVYREPRLDVRALWVEALGRLGHARALPVLLKFAATAQPWVVAQAVAAALMRHPTRESVDRLIDLLWSDDDGVRFAAYEALVKITGKRDLKAEPKDWVAWWGKHREGFVPPARGPKPDGTVPTLPAEPMSVPTYYDIPIRGRRVVFCMDVSASMWGPKFEAALAELSRAIRTLPTTYRFGLIFFNEYPVLWRKTLTPAHPFQKLECVSDFDGLRTKKFTNIYDTVERALGFAGLGRWPVEGTPGVDDIFFLTDGEPNRGKYRDQKHILKGLDELDPMRRVRIHAISVGDDPKELMAAIAAAHGGRHVHVDAKK